MTLKEHAYVHFDYTYRCFGLSGQRYDNLFYNLQIYISHFYDVIEIMLLLFNDRSLNQNLRDLEEFLSPHAHGIMMANALVVV